MKIEELKNLMVEIKGEEGDFSEKIEYQVVCDFGETEKYRFGIEYIESSMYAPMRVFLIVPVADDRREVLSTRFSEEVMQSGNLASVIRDWIRKRINKQKESNTLEELERILFSPDKGEE